jgi:hypothetical protein
MTWPLRPSSSARSRSPLRPKPTRCFRRRQLCAPKPKGGERDENTEHPSSGALSRSRTELPGQVQTWRSRSPLAERSDCQKRLEQIRDRLERSARIQEDEQPAEDPTELLSETDRIYTRLLELISAINRTNSRTAFDNARTISDAIAERDVMGKRRDFLAGVAGSANSRWDRYSKSEVRYVMTVPVGKLRADADQLAKRYWELDLRIQELNWKAELI